MPERSIDTWTIDDLFGGRENLKRRAARAPKSALVKGIATGDDALNVVAKDVLEGLADGSAELRLVNHAKTWVAGIRLKAPRRRAIAEFAIEMNADCKTMVAWMIFKGVIT